MDKNANFSTLCLMILKEVRLERGVHQGNIAAVIGKTPSAWTKIENGQSSLTFDVFFGACSVLGYYPGQVTALMDQLIPMFGANHFYFQTGTLNEKEDDLLNLVIQYFNSKGYESLKSRPFERVSILNLGSPFVFSGTPTIVRYCCEPEFKKWIDEGAEGPAPNMFQQPQSF
ncbi:helix-turn-helix domain-containing protein [Vibrio crassostreae]|uniref:helix-turn-helix domain-containing protein n=1 Tax=Vibrio crassostreae TaxID=246167 RepID=UPI001047F09F|nr:helix-turn-helix transcriptional regulator [Vibrio crassostreae]TCT45183.1 helix-turn-helix protein [Vibrio crassostreae]